jgi:ArsR family transcriptional regulator, arsenate/arsenite/antimonite-responsive transcriptional repressor
MKDTIKIFNCISDKNRLRIIMMLLRKSLCVCEITDILDLSPSTVSNHLSILKEAGFLLDSKFGKWVIYSINKETTDTKIQQTLLMLQMWLNSDEQVLSDSSKIDIVDRNNLCNIQ